MIKTRFYTVIGIRIDTFESAIEFERHYPTKDQAAQAAQELQKDGLFPIIATIANTATLAIRTPA